MSERPQYYFEYTDHKRGLRIALAALVFTAIAAGIFFGAMWWVRSLARGLEVAPVSVCERCGKVLDGTDKTCEGER